MNERVEERIAELQEEDSEIEMTDGICNRALKGFVPLRPSRGRGMCLPDNCVSVSAHLIRFGQNIVKALGGENSKVTVLHNSQTGELAFARDAFGYTLRSPGYITKSKKVGESLGEAKGMFTAKLVARDAFVISIRAKNKEAAAV